MTPSNRRRRYGLALVALLGMALVVSVLYGRMRDLGPAPAITYTTIDGVPGSMTALRGKVVLVNFWATSCTTCVKEMPMLIDTHRRYAAQGYETLAIAMAYDPPNYVLDFARSRALPFKVTLDPQGELAQAFGKVQLTPTSFLVDRRGRIVKRYLGEPDAQALHQSIETLLSAKKA